MALLEFLNMVFSQPIIIFAMILYLTNKMYRRAIERDKREE